MPLFDPNAPVYYLNKRQVHGFGGKLKLNRIYRKACQFFGATLIDRTGTLTAGVNYQIIDPIPAYLEETPRFGEIAHLRARGIVDATGEQPLKVLWSGGIDSTVALIALIRVLEPRGKLDRLTILHSQESIDEFSTFFHSVIQGKLRMERIETKLFDHIQPEEIIITGEHGDQLFGSDKLKYSILTEEAYRPFRDVSSFYISRKLGTERYTEAIEAMIEPQLTHSPIPIETWYDYLWWMNFSLKWQTVSMRLIHGLGRTHEALDQSVFHFFRSDLFQQWSMAHHDQKIKHEWHTYKFVAKEYIHDFHPDEAYLQFKEKEQSLKEVLVTGSRR
ncbi:hypothetical protein [Pontibacter sp. G13]|uniref:hypothetical protein n=1 Tax=Pontibacter sp. G13 TaxID=3074898 RepID=UPI002889ED56|nr:hypothetical protein [Pontibacter sp. G13]WNJ18388.1 hypothetical protein RJD25_26335 [Pontibacter sp. G13]